MKLLAFANLELLSKCCLLALLRDYIQIQTAKKAFAKNNQWAILSTPKKMIKWVYYSIKELPKPLPPIALPPIALTKPLPALKPSLDCLWINFRKKNENRPNTILSWRITLNRKISHCCRSKKGAQIKALILLSSSALFTKEASWGGIFDWAENTFGIS